MPNEQDYQQEVLSALIRWTIAIGLPVGLLNMAGYLVDPAWTTPVGSGTVLVLALIAWGCLRLARAGRLRRAARLYMFSGMLLMALIVFVTSPQELLLGAMGLSVFVIMATFFEPPRAALAWGVLSAGLYESAIAARHFVPSLDLGFSVRAISLYVVPPIVLLFFALIGRIMTQHLRGALLQSEAARRDLAQAHAEVELRVEEQTRDLVIERNRLDAALVELERARDQAEAANRAKSAFLANMSHELRTPLTAILGYSELLQHESLYPGNAPYLNELQTIWSAGQQLLALIDAMIDLSQIEAERLELSLETFDVAALVGEVATIARPLIAKRENQLEVHCADDLAPMRTDRARVRQVLFNLISNAAKFTERGTVALRVRSEQEGPAAQSAATEPQTWIVFEVSDTGIGIPPDYMPRLFEKFAQADASPTRRYGGAGLGLAISRHFCQLMGGDIQATSAPGRGTVFTVRLPAEVADPRAPHDPQVATCHPH